jgi:hypothetical protein
VESHLINSDGWHEDFPDGRIWLHRPGHDAELLRRGHSVEALARSEQSAQAVTGTGRSRQQTYRDVGDHWCQRAKTEQAT